MRCATAAHCAQARPCSCSAPPAARGLTDGRGCAESVRQLERWYAEGKLRPHVSQTFPLHRTAEALKLMAARQVKGKVVLLPR